MLFQSNLLGQVTVDENTVLNFPNGLPGFESCQRFKLFHEEGKTTVFIEVKTRRKGTSYFPAEAVTIRKQRQISRTAQEYLLRHKLQHQSARFDVISVSMAQDGTPEIDHIANAFDLSHDDC